MKKLLVCFVFILTSIVMLPNARAAHVSCGDTITSDTVLDSNLSCSGTAITIGANNVVLDCNGLNINGTFNGSSLIRGVSVSNYNNTVIKNCNIRNFTYGIYSLNSYFLAVNNNTLTSNFIGIYLEISKNFTVVGNKISSSDIGFYISSPSTGLVDNNIFERNKYAVSLPGSANSVIKNNYIINSSSVGIALQSDNNTIFNNTIISMPSSSYGISVETFSDNNKIWRNTLMVKGIDDNSKPITNIISLPYSGPNIYCVGVGNRYLSGAGESRAPRDCGPLPNISTFSIDSANTNTIDFDESAAGTFFHNSLSEAVENGNYFKNQEFVVEDSSGLYEVPVFIDNLPYTTINCNQNMLNGTGQGDGIKVTQSNNTKIRNCIIQNTRNAILYQGSPNGIVEGNTLFGNDNNAVYFFLSNNSAAKNNTITGKGDNSIGIRFDFLENFTAQDNTVSYTNLGITVQDPSTGGVIANNTLTSSKYGLALNHLMNSQVINNLIINSSSGGISLSSSDNNKIYNNNILSNSSSSNGISLFDSSKNTIWRNIVLRNGRGIHLTRVGNTTITENRISLNNYGLWIDSGVASENLTIKFNDINNNTEFNLNNRQPGPVLVPYNWWGTTNVSQIFEFIWDGSDGGQFGLVSVIPFLDESVSFRIFQKSLPLAKLREFSSDQLTAIPGNPPYVWSLVNGTLPPGMTFSSEGILSGSPTELGNFTFAIRVTDSSNDIFERIFAKRVVFELPSPQVRLTKFGSLPVPGRVIDYFIMVENVGEVVADNLEITEYIEPWFSYLSANPAPSNVSSSIFPLINGTDKEVIRNITMNSTLIWDIDTLQPGEAGLYSYKALLGRVPIGTPVAGGPACIQPRDDPCLQEYLGRLNNLAVACGITCAYYGSQSGPVPKSGLDAINKAIFGVGGEEPLPNACFECIKFTKNFIQGRVEACRMFNPWRVICDESQKTASGPIDPNEKLVVAEKFIKPRQLLVYPIHYENIGNVSARDVFITDILEANLDVSTVKVEHPEQGFIPLSDGETLNLFEREKNITETFGDFSVNITILENWTVSLNGRAVEWRLRGIELPPNATDAVALSVQPIAGLPSGTEIRNNATIQFEIFESLTTNSTSNIIDDVKPECVMNPLPKTTFSEEFPISWSGTDAVGEIDYYLIFVSGGGSTYALINRTTNTSTVFNGEPGTHYEFICMATDTAGNQEETSGVEEAGITINNQSFECTNPPSGLISWWPGEGSARDFQGKTILFSDDFNDNSIDSEKWIASISNPNITLSEEDGELKFSGIAPTKNFDRVLNPVFPNRDTEVSVLFKTPIVNNFGGVQLSMQGPEGFYSLTFRSGEGYRLTNNIAGNSPGTYWQCGNKQPIGDESVNFHKLEMKYGASNGKVDAYVDDVFLCSLQRFVFENIHVGLALREVAGNFDVRFDDYITGNEFSGANPGVLNNGVSFTGGKLGKAFSFDGVNDFVDFGNIFNFERTDKFTFDFWIKQEPTLNTSNFIIAKQDNYNPEGANNGQGYVIATNNNGNIRFSLINNQNGGISNWLGVGGPTNIRDGKFHHVAITYDGSSAASGASIYVDGKKETPYIVSDTLTGSITTQESFRFGAREGATFALFNGALDEVRVYNRVLAQEEIQALLRTDETENCQIECTDPDEDGFGNPETDLLSCTGSVSQSDNCPNAFNSDQLNSDGDGEGDLCDACPLDFTNSCDTAESSSSNVNGSGGTITTTSGNAEVNIPPNALATDTSISISGSNETPTTTEAIFRIQTSAEPVSLIYSFTPEGAIFGEPVVITLVYNDKEELDESTIDIYFFNTTTQQWEAQNAVCDTELNQCIIAVTHFSDFIVGGFLDSDSDGVLDTDDLCPGSVQDNINLNPNQYGQNIEFGAFEAGPNNGQSTVYNMSTTKGCTCTQIVEKLDAGEGHLKKGCSPSLMEEWAGINAEEDRKTGIGKNKK